MKTYKVLVLTDHQGHSKENSIYAILTEMLQHEQCQQIDIASRGLVENHLFFENHQSDALHVSTLDAEFKFTESGEVSYNKIQDNSGKQYYIPFYGTYQQNRFIMMSSSKFKRSFMILE